MNATKTYLFPNLPTIEEQREMAERALGASTIAAILTADAGEQVWLMSDGSLKWLGSQEHFRNPNNGQVFALAGYTCSGFGDLYLAPWTWGTDVDPDSLDSVDAAVDFIEETMNNVGIEEVGEAAKILSALCERDGQS